MSRLRSATGHGTLSFCREVESLRRAYKLTFRSGDDAIIAVDPIGPRCLERLDAMVRAIREERQTPWSPEGSIAIKENSVSYDRYVRSTAQPTLPPSAFDEPTELKHVRALLEGAIEVKFVNVREAPLEAQLMVLDAIAGIPTILGVELFVDNDSCGATGFSDVGKKLAEVALKRKLIATINVPASERSMDALLGPFDESSSANLHLDFAAMGWSGGALYSLLQSSQQFGSVFSDHDLIQELLVVTRINHWAKEKEAKKMLKAEARISENGSESPTNNRRPASKRPREEVDGSESDEEDVAGADGSETAADSPTDHTDTDEGSAWCCFSRYGGSDEPTVKIAAGSAYHVEAPRRILRQFSSLPVFDDESHACVDFGRGYLGDLTPEANHVEWDLSGNLNLTISQIDDLMDFLTNGNFSQAELDLYGRHPIADTEEEKQQLREVEARMDSVVATSAKADIVPSFSASTRDFCNFTLKLSHNWPPLSDYDPRYMIALTRAAEYMGLSFAINVLLSMLAAVLVAKANSCSGRRKRAK